jgi:hypothetical protein
MFARLKAWAIALALTAIQALAAQAQQGASGPGSVKVDTALVVSVDISNSVDENRYRLQMEGIAAALEDSGVIEAITNGPNGGILFSMVTWADRPDFTLPWVKISNKEEALAVAARIRKLPQQGGEFTCMTRMMRSVNDKIMSQIPAEATRMVLDVSGDGPDNCNADEPIEGVRDELVANGVTVNGLPINSDDAPPAQGSAQAAAPPGGNGKAAASSIEEWYREHVMGGIGAFVLPANGYADFGRAIRQKFVIEISGLSTPGHLRLGAAQSNVSPR